MARFNGTKGNDQLHGTAANDDMSGGAGSDQLTGNGGDDLLNGGDGNDYLAGDVPSGSQFPVDGIPGYDTLLGGAGSDYLDGGPGRDTYNGGPGDDYYYDMSIYSPYGGSETNPYGEPDLFIFDAVKKGNFGEDRIQGFDQYADRIEFHGYTAGDILAADLVFDQYSGAGVWLFALSDGSHLRVEGEYSFYNAPVRGQDYDVFA